MRLYDYINEQNISVANMSVEEIVKIYMEKYGKEKAIKRAKHKAKDSEKMKQVLARLTGAETAAPKEAPKATTKAPKTEGSKTSIDSLFEKLKGQYGDKEVGKSYFQVYRRGDKVVVDYDYTFRRSTKAEELSRVGRENSILTTISIDAKQKGFKTELKLPTKESVKPTDGDPAYSEYEQTIGGSVTIWK